jgi:hypothetical protein
MTPSAKGLVAVRALTELLAVPYNFLIEPQRPGWLDFTRPKSISAVGVLCRADAYPHGVAHPVK